MLKTKDIVVKDGRLYVVSDIKMSNSGVLVKILPIVSEKSEVVSVNELELEDQKEFLRRQKSTVSFKSNSNKTNTTIAELESIIKDARKLLADIAGG